MSKQIERLKRMAVDAGAVITPATAGVFFNDESLARFVLAVAEECAMAADNLGEVYHEFEGAHPSGKKDGAFESAAIIRNLYKGD